MKTTLCIDRLPLVTTLGCDEQEQSIPRTVYISVRLTGDFSQAVLSDKLEDAVDYIAVTDDILAYGISATNHLLEHLARDIIGLCLEYSLVDHVWIKIEKEYLQKDFKAVGVEMEVTR